MNVSKSTQDALMEIIKQCFIENRVLDRFVSVLGVKFACNNMANLIHQNIAHYFPEISDQIGELCLERYNISVEYGATPEAKEDYNSVTEMMQILEDRIIDFQNMFIAVEKVAFENNDLQVFADLSKLMEGYNQISEQAILLNDKMKYYGEDRIMAMDKDIRDSFWILTPQPVQVVQPAQIV